MKDGVTKGTGNSRYLKSAITDSTTWEQFRAADLLVDHEYRLTLLELGVI